MKTHFRQLTLSMMLAFAGQAQAAALWQESNDPTMQTQASGAKMLQQARYFSVDQNVLRKQLLSSEEPRIEIPSPKGGFLLVQLREASVMAPELSAKYPSLKSYIGYDSKGQRIGRFSSSEKGFKGMYRIDGKVAFLEPQSQSAPALYINYFKHDAFSSEISQFTDKVVVEALKSSPEKPTKGFHKSSGDVLRTYRIAIAATAEYTAYHGGTKADALSALNDLVTRINEIYETELAVSFELVADNDLIIFTDAASDPYANDSGTDDLDVNQTTIDNAIGNSNYDIGHLVGTGAGGIASLGSVCNSQYKARGLTGLAFPEGDPFYVDYVAHEIGHQMSGNHSFNGTESSCENRNAGTAFEPGSGSTIMGYAGICGSQNIQNRSDAYFHVGSLNEMRTFIDDGSGGTCGTTSTLQNTIPQADAGQDYSIPANTPFVLSGSGSDADNDSLTYMWEQLDPNGTPSSSPETMIDNGSRPLFRSWTPQSQATRYFPRQEDVLDGETVLGETYPTTTRDLNFRLTVRDGKGGVAHDAMVVSTVAKDVGFSVRYPTADNSWFEDRKGLLLWNVAGSNAAPISCSAVDIEYSTNGGSSFVALDSDVVNDGIYSVSAPDITSDSVLLKVSCPTSIFYTISSAFAIVSASGAPVDSDGDGMSDEFEATYGFDPQDPSDAALDTDDDGLSNLEEYLLGTDPEKADSDGDGMPDQYEVQNRFSPTDSSDANGDADGDGVSNLEEYQAGTDPNDSASSPNITSKTYDFESETDLNDWEFGTSQQWTRTEATAAGGSYSIVSADVSDNEISEVSLTTTFEAGTVTFGYKVSSESGWDYLRFYVDDAMIGEWSGEIDWSGYSYQIEQGQHTLKWRYEKDESVSEGDDLAWIDNVVIPVRTEDDNSGSGGSSERVDLDYDGDGKADVAVRRPATSLQYISNSSNDVIQRIEFGSDSNDVPVTGDFDGDGIFDIAVRRPSTQYWYINNSSGVDNISDNNDGITRLQFGLREEDIPVPADYDGDGITDLAVRRPSNQYWYIRNSSGVDALTGNADGITRLQFGLNQDDIPVPADYDGDGKADLAVRRASNQYWYILNSSGVDGISGNSDGITRQQFGTREEDIPVPADFDGDGKADLAVRRPSTQYWYILNSSGGNYNSAQQDGIQRIQFGLQSEDIPIVADYDGDGYADIAVRRPSNQYQYILRSSDGVITRLKFGLQSTDIPLAAPILTRMAMAESN